MSTCIIVGAGDASADLLTGKAEGDLLIAADGGLKTLKEAGLTPDVWIGDADSLNAPPDDLPVIKLPVVKDDTDLIAACRYGLKRGYRRFALYGVLGGRRFSHSVAAVQTLSFLRDNNADGTIIDPCCTVRLLRGESVAFTDAPTRFFSLFSVTERAVVSVAGAKYPLCHETLVSSFPLGISNEFQLPTTITVESGDVLMVLDR